MKNSKYTEQSELIKKADSVLCFWNIMSILWVAKWGSLWFGLAPACPINWDLGKLEDWSTPWALHHCLSCCSWAIFRHDPCASPRDIKGHCKDKMQEAHNQTLACDELGQEQVVKTEKEKRGLDLSFTKGLATYCTLNLRRRHPFNRYTGMKQWWFSASILTSFHFSQSQDRPNWQGFLISIVIIVWL